RGMKARLATAFVFELHLGCDDCSPSEG
ncbi:hypothetical protein A2U01_0075167, partial [Trifolium medium]|nr:hypothetical protein [Trifolium medium]